MFLLKIEPTMYHLGFQLSLEKIFSKRPFSKAKKNGSSNKQNQDHSRHHPQPPSNPAERSPHPPGREIPWRRRARRLRGAPGFQPRPPRQHVWLLIYVAKNEWGILFEEQTRSILMIITKSKMNDLQMEHVRCSPIILHGSTTHTHTHQPSPTFRPTPCPQQVFMMQSTETLKMANQWRPKSTIPSLMHTIKLPKYLQSIPLYQVIQNQTCMAIWPFGSSFSSCP